MEIYYFGVSINELVPKCSIKNVLFFLTNIKFIQVSPLRQSCWSYLQLSGFGSNTVVYNQNPVQYSRGTKTEVQYWSSDSMQPNCADSINTVDVNLTGHWSTLKYHEFTKKGFCVLCVRACMHAYFK